MDDARRDSRVHLHAMDKMKKALAAPKERGDGKKKVANWELEIWYHAQMVRQAQEKISFLRGETKLFCG